MKSQMTTLKLLAAYLLARMLELQYVFWRGAAVHQKLLQRTVKSDNEGRANVKRTMNTFSSKSTSFLGISNIMTHKSYSIIVETSLKCFSHSKIMTAVTSHLCLSGLISKMPPGSAKHIAMQLYEQTGQSASLCLYIFYFSFYFIFGLG